VPPLEAGTEWTDRKGDLMTRAVKAKAKRRRQAPPPPPKRSPWVERGLVGLVALGVVVLAAGLWRVAGDGGTTSATDAGPVHVHCLGVNPADGALFIATHTGLYRAGEGDSKSVRVGDNKQDTMGFTVAGADRFLGSGHPLQPRLESVRDGCASRRHAGPAPDPARPGGR
jgi:hypothetical protein